MISKFLFHMANLSSVKIKFSGKPAEIFKNYRLLLQFPYAVLVSNDSYLELIKKDEVQLRVGQSSVLEFISPNHLNAMQGAFFV